MSEKSPVRTGDRFALLVAIKVVGKTSGGHFIWEMQCDCGGKCYRATNSLKQSAKRGAHTSCGCSRFSPAKKHGKRNTGAYSSWRAAKFRCHNPRSKDYQRYGGAGIFMCEEWRKSFESFYAELGDRPEGTTLDRIDGNKGYEPGNCRWADINVQASNRKAGLVSAIVDGKELTAKQFANLVGISHAAAINRIRRGRLYV